MHNGHLRPGPDGDMGALEGNVPAAHKEQTPGQRLQVQKRVTQGEMVGPWERQGGGLGAGGHHHMRPVEHRLAHGHRRPSDKARPAMEGLDARLRKALLEEGRRGVRVGALEPHQRRPIDPHLGGPDPLAGHPLHGIQGFAGTHQHLFGMAAPQCTGPAKRPRINDGDGPPRGTTARRHDCCS
jgi:hypothetical protein